MSDAPLPIRWTKGALLCAQEIHASIAKDSPAQAKSFVAELKDQINLLGRFPGMGRSGRLVGTRELIVDENYYVVYRVHNGAVEVIRLRHVAQKNAVLGRRA